MNRRVDSKACFLHRLRLLNKIITLTLKRVYKKVLWNTTHKVKDKNFDRLKTFKVRISDPKPSHLDYKYVGDLKSVTRMIKIVTIKSSLSSTFLNYIVRQHFVVDVWEWHWWQWQWWQWQWRKLYIARFIIVTDLRYWCKNRYHMLVIVVYSLGHQYLISATFISNWSSTHFVSNICHLDRYNRI